LLEVPGDPAPVGTSRARSFVFLDRAFDVVLEDEAEPPPEEREDGQRRGVDRRLRESDQVADVS
jgi:hypothetical protein